MKTTFEQRKEMRERWAGLKETLRPHKNNHTALAGMAMFELGKSKIEALQLLDDLDELRAIVDKLRIAANKVVLCFPDRMDSRNFDIPAYIITELREAAEAAEKK